MKHRILIRLLLLMVIILIVEPRAIAQKDQIEHLWYNEEKTAKISIYKTESGKFFGKVVWLKVPNRNGKPKVDVHNPDKKKQNEPIMGLLILRNFTKTSENIYDKGEIYDPKNGKNYSCIITYKGEKLDVRGYVGFSFIGRSTIWMKAEDN